MNTKAKENIIKKITTKTMVHLEKSIGTARPRISNASNRNKKHPMEISTTSNPIQTTAATISITVKLSTFSNDIDKRKGNRLKKGCRLIELKDCLN